MHSAFLNGNCWYTPGSFRIMGGEKVTIGDAKISMGLEGLPVGRAWVVGTLLRQGWGEQAESGADYTNNYCILVQLVKDYFKWLGWRAEVGV